MPAGTFASFSAQRDISPFDEPMTDVAPDLEGQGLVQSTQALNETPFMQKNNPKLGALLDLNEPSNLVEGLDRYARAALAEIRDPFSLPREPASYVPR